jgi:hypothetical protein
MFFNDHNPPHFHVATRDGRDAQVEIATLRVIRGRVDRRALREATEWASTRREVLMEIWRDYSSD